MQINADATTIGGGLSVVFAIIASFLLKHLHGQIAAAASKADLAEALRHLAEQRLEDMKRIEQQRIEQNGRETAIFNRLREQDIILTRIDERTQSLMQRSTQGG